MLDEAGRALREAARDTLTEWLRQVEAGEATYRARWQDDGSVVLEEMERWPIHERGYRLTVLVEPVETWRASTWREVAELGKGARVRLNDQEAVVTHAHHAGPNSPWTMNPTSKWPRKVMVDVVFIQLEGRDRWYQMAPDGPVEVSTGGGPVGPALDVLLGSFDLEEVRDEAD